MTIRYLPHKKIDKARWDATVAAAPNGLVYAYSWYLDALSGPWDALVIDDYEYVMPLPWRKKIGIQYLFQPDLTPVLGLFGPATTRDIMQKILSAIPSKFKLWDISLNHDNDIPDGLYPVYRRSNYVLSLRENYEALKNRFNNNCTRNIKKALNANCQIEKGINIEDIIELSKEQFKTFTDFDEANFLAVASIFRDHLADHKGITYGVFDKNKRLLASCAFLFSNGRAYYWLVGNHPSAKEFAASFLLIDQFIRDYAGTDLVLDFEGSDTDSIAKFYKGFGASDESYNTIYYSKLPSILKLFKKDPYKH